MVSGSFPRSLMLTFQTTWRLALLLCILVRDAHSRKPLSCLLRGYKFLLPNLMLWLKKNGQARIGILTDLGCIRTIGVKPRGPPVSQCIKFAPGGVWKLWKVRHRSSRWCAARLLAARCEQESVGCDDYGQ